ncbi:diphosphoinositol polyphosphate phosphohydrolase 1-like [Tropilaelaps mercedesae]|uniref:diphosphoinositol-polyphosphate diphosphatase n=1 Tax=Tropilaelaps mercedesae TaxID=418985 RepID=A0A1V9XA99_9ACAR|nr:diphosphoinositol polyphosphate phosphohydrolase 1-like [Tropilaelaps mercedesae]
METVLTDSFTVLILLVSSSSTPDRFIVPGGGLEPDEDAETAAIREVMEEAGVRGSLVRCLGVFENAERRHRTQVFVLQVEELLEEWDDSKSIGRQRKWFTVPNALEELMVSKPVQCNYVQLLANKTAGPTSLSPTGVEDGNAAVSMNNPNASSSHGLHLTGSNNQASPAPAAEQTTT